MWDTHSAAGSASTCFYLCHQGVLSASSLSVLFSPQEFFGAIEAKAAWALARDRFASSGICCLLYVLIIPHLELLYNLGMVRLAYRYLYTQPLDTIVVIHHAPLVCIH